MTLLRRIALLLMLIVMSHAQDKELEAEDRKVKVMGQSGMITYGEEDLKKQAVTIEFNSLTEVDANGNAVGTTENVTHDFNAFANQSFTINQVMDNHQIYNVSTKMFSYAALLSSLNATMKVYVYIMKQDANVTIEGEDVMIRKGMLKFSIEISDWQWCGCSNGTQEETGEFVDVALVIKGKGNAKKLNMTDEMKQESYDLGSDQMLYLSKKVQVDGTWQNMTNGFPKMEMKGSKQIFTFRIPKFNQKALYDPMVTVPSTPGLNPTPSTEPNSGTVHCLCIFALIVALFSSLLNC